MVHHNDATFFWAVLCCLGVGTIIVLVASLPFSGRDLREDRDRGREFGGDDGHHAHIRSTTQYAEIVSPARQELCDLVNISPSNCSQISWFQTPGNPNLLHGQWMDGSDTHINLYLRSANSTSSLSWDLPEDVFQRFVTARTVTTTRSSPTAQSPTTQIPTTRSPTTQPPAAKCFITYVPGLKWPAQSQPQTFTLFTGGLSATPQNNGSCLTSSYLKCVFTEILQRFNAPTQQHPFSVINSLLMSSGVGPGLAINGQNDITFGTIRLAQAAQIVAITSLQWSGTQILEFDQIYNIKNFGFANIDELTSQGKGQAVDTESVGMHEWTHCFGAADQTSSHCSNSTCYAYTTYGSIKQRALDPDSQQGMIDLYGGSIISQTTSSSCTNVKSTGLSSQCQSLFGYVSH